jgi:hypothetical protein
MFKKLLPTKQFFLHAPTDNCSVNSYAKLPTLFDMVVFKLFTKFTLKKIMNPKIRIYSMRACPIEFLIMFMIIESKRIKNVTTEEISSYVLEDF